MEIERAQAIANVAGVIVNSAKVEVDFMRVTGAVGGSDFIPAEPRKGLPGASSSGLNGRKHPALGRSESDH